MLRTYDGRPIHVVRHQSAPPSLGCRWCGFGERGHARLWVPSHGWHTWVEPTRAQIQARLRARLEGKS